MGFFDRFRKGVEFVPGDVSYSNNDNFARNMVSVRTVTYADGWLGGTYSSLYRRQPAVRSVVDFLARNIGQLNPKVFERIDDTDRVEVNDHPLAVLLRNPNKVTTRYAHLRDTVADLAIYDRAYWRKIREGGQIQVLRLPPSKVTIEQKEGRRVYCLPDGTELGRRDLVIFSGYSPDGDSDGVSPLETLRSVLAEESSSISSRQAMWNNFARNGGVIERPMEAPTWSDEARERFRSDWDAKFTGSANAGKTPVLEEGMTWKDTSVDAPADDYIDGRRLTREEVAITYFGPVAGRAFLQATGTGTDATHRQIYQDVLGPWLRMLQDEIDLQLKPDFEPFPRQTYTEFNLAEKLKGSFEEQATILTTSVGVPVMSVNEGRARLNLPKIDEEWADQPVQPLNVMYGGQPAVQIPTATPGSPGSPTGKPVTPALGVAGTSSARELAEIIQKIYLGVGVVLSAEEARAIVASAGADLPGDLPGSDLGKALVRHFDRQSRASKHDAQRWTRELAEDLTPIVGEKAPLVAFNAYQLVMAADQGVLT